MPATYNAHPHTRKAGARAYPRFPHATAGRNPQSSVFLDDITVSRKHAEIRNEPDGWYIRDLGSLNGTYVNRERVESTKLASRDEVQIGKFRLVFFAGE